MRFVIDRTGNFGHLVQLWPPRQATKTKRDLDDDQGRHDGDNHFALEALLIARPY
jgi:hypothetical protein